MKTLKAPPGHASVVVEGRQYNVDRRGFVEVDENHVVAIQAHNPEFVTYEQAKAKAASEPSIQTVDPAARAEIERLQAQIAELTKSHETHVEATGGALEDLDRKTMFANLKAMGVVVSQTLKTDALREIYAAETAKAGAAGATGATGATGSSGATGATGTQT